MEHQKELAKIALTAFMVAATLPAHAIHDTGLEAQGSYLAAGCGAHGCDSVPGDRRPEYDFRGEVKTTTSTLTEAQLMGMLNDQTRNIYLSLDPEGKALAIQLASQESYKDKNLAVKEAQRRMNERVSTMNR